MKTKLKTKIQKNTFRSLAVVIVFAVVLANVNAAQFVQNIYANKSEQLEKEINELQAKISESKGQANELNQKSKTLQEELNKLKSQKNTIQAEIEVTSKQNDKLESEIEQTKKKMSDNRKALGSVLAEMSLEDDVSPLERIAGSENISNALDGFEYKSAVKTSLTTKVNEIKEAKITLEKKKTELDEVIRTQKFKRTELAAKEDEQKDLLNKTKGEESEYQKHISGQQNKVAELKAEQEKLAAFNLNYSQNNGINVPSGGIAGGGGYPAVWANAPLNAYVDTWGLYSRQCVSYAAWKVYSTGRFVPHFAGRGNAYEWPSTTARHGIQNGSAPRKGSVAIDPNVGMGYGHAMYVEEVYGNGTIRVSDYNYLWDGLYREYDRSAGGLTYIYF